MEKLRELHRQCAEERRKQRLPEFSPAPPEQFPELTPRELRKAFSLNSLPSADFFVNAVYFRIQTLGYNLISALKLIKLPANWRTLTLKMLRFRLLAIPALIVKHARALWPKTNNAHPYQTISNRSSRRHPDTSTRSIDARTILSYW